ncbi:MULTISPECIES: FAD-dependent monooxygenase [unclassified Paenibacillus]|uniref:FAD-dependent monooxygenase n=1 Tax=unclassified Paenibacillus TaxID=185978 RepID=UPI001AE9CCFF|nr:MULTISPECIES: FAD-dependent monooxygenase [unclassified Paenibacillus]MBP1154072.1 salicylate hydroxylase [Paenibacillus sp. PvP091]MBP1170543.1 salicylate hydroxylase [Paenibacillus sp. PvR098]MBP2441571.1 salicylate hydroxylase [Paenibacillus sp. PvP052]
MTNEKDVPFLIVGGGIGGLATALGVAKTGRSVQVLESAPEFAEIGAGIQLAPNATAVLDQLGVLDAISEFAVFPKRLVLMDAVTGKELSALDLGESFRERYGHPYIVLHRSDLHKALLDACIADDRITLLNNKTVKTAENMGDKAQVTCTDGTSYLSDAVIGADGLWSSTRQLFSQDKAICSQYVAYRGAIPMSEITPSADLDDVIMWIGPNLHLVQYPVRRKELYNQVVVFKSFRYKEDSDDWGTPEELDEHFGKCCEPVRHAVTFIQRQRRWPMYDREPIDNWTSGRITLLGDAAHPMLQYLAQGGCQALEDAACLTKQLSLHGNDTEKAFLAYQEDRIPRTAKVQRSARLWGEFLHTEDSMATFLRNMMLAQRGPQNFETSDWLYGRRYN